MRSSPKPNAKPGVLLGVDADALEHVGVDHAAAAELDPARLRAHPAAVAVAEDAAHRELGRRLGVGEEVGAEPGADALVVEQPAHEGLDGAEQVGEGDAAVDGERLDLVEHRRVPGVEGLVAVGAAGRDHEDRRRHRLHRADLHRRRVRAQHDLLGLAQLDVERVLHRAGRVPGHHVERLEVVPVVFDLGTLHDPVAHADEDVLELALHLGDEVEVPAAAARGRRA